MPHMPHDTTLIATIVAGLVLAFVADCESGS
jgi:predicted Kef-type K+ transport protein